MTSYPIPEPNDPVWSQIREVSKLIGRDVNDALIWGMTPRGVIVYDRQLKVLLTRPFDEILKENEQ